ncbi:MAG: hypothetical protein HC905_16400 [Bacteroidales bacterium]|nr:hypothetical protein [Bacteroidales bacterium]
MQKIIKDIEEISCIVGGNKAITIIYKDLSIKTLAISLKVVEEQLCQSYFEKINYHAIINTKHLSLVESKRTILLKNGVRFKVSRKKWDLFKLIGKR